MIIAVFPIWYSLCQSLPPVNKQSLYPLLLNLGLNFGPASTNVMNRTLSVFEAGSNKVIRPPLFLSLVIITCESSHQAAKKFKLACLGGQHGSRTCKGSEASSLQPAFGPQMWEWVSPQLNVASSLYVLQPRSQISRSKGRLSQLHHIQVPNPQSSWA